MRKLGKRLRLSSDEVELINESRGENLQNINGNTALDLHLQDRGIDKKDVVSVKHWQNMGGDLRFSIVTKEQSAIEQTDLLEDVKALIDNHAPTYPKIKRVKGDNLLIINPADIHIGKLAVASETGEDYNTEIACARVLEGIEGLISKSQGFNVDRVLFCIGNDILHTDGVLSTTTRGTYQDTDKKWWQHYEIALELYVKCVEILRQVAPVDVVHSMSNHDFQSGFHLAHALQSWFRKADDVSFDISVANRKYYKYGSNLIGLEHGDGAKMDLLPMLMANEKPKEWSETSHRYWYLHHIHHKVKYKWLDGKDFIGCTVEYMRSPSAADSWHAGKGFISSPAVEGFIHSKSSGQIARLVHYF